ncbi:uncharacterized protein RJT21DRAFT_26295 [Scheffersomyces amazonensis]|uniref:uncharacterized protein n=1 Tax=Scheffersomyces amazonensis TaxID=1078765 RepID=UPI00315CA3FC
MSNSIAEAFKKLNVSSSSEPSDHENIYSVSYEYLSRVKNFNDARSFKTCLVALINLDKYYKAFEIIKKITDHELISDAILEVAYVYYKLGKSNALNELYNIQNKNIDNEGVRLGLNHILAQNYYKVGDYNKALKLYHELIENNKYDNKSDLIINERAVISQLNFNQQLRLTSEFSREDNYDLYFNEALIELANSNLSVSLEYLERAQELCLTQNAQWSNSDLLIELLPIKLTIAYIYQLQGDEAKSLTILHEYNNVDSTINDSMIKLIIKNNLYALDNEQINANVIDSEINYQKNLQQLNAKLTKFQYQVLYKNDLLLRYLSGTLSKSRLTTNFITQYIQDFPGDYLPLVYKILLDLEISYKDLSDSTKLKTIGRKLFKFIKSIEDKSKPELKLGLLLLVFINEKSNNFDQSLPLLEEYTSNEISTRSNEKLTPAIHGAYIQILENFRYTKKLGDYLNELIDSLFATDANIIRQDLNYFNFIKVIAFKSLSHPTLQEESLKLFKHLNDIYENDKLVSSILSNSVDSLLSIEELTSNVQPIDDLLAVSNIEDLLPSVGSNKGVTKKIGKVVKPKKTKKAKFGPNKILKPEGSDLALDDERWLPMKLRSYYKPSKKEKKKGSHQGAIESPTSSAASTPAPTSASTSNAPAKSSGNSGSSSGKNKKKKKGKK